MRLIDADELMEHIWRDRLDSRELIANLVKAMPTIEPKKGKWLPFEYGDESWHKCSVCGKGDQFKHKVIRENGEVHYMESVRNYCPTCGADMRGEQDE